MRLRLPVPLRWADLDAYGHVNNVAVLRLLEEARIAAFWAHPGQDVPALASAILDAGPGAGTHTLVARQEIEYLLPIGYHRDPVVVEMWLGHLGGASIDVCYEVLAPGEADDDERGLVPHVRATTTLVLIDAATGRPRRIAPAERDVWGRYVEEPVRMRRRS